MQGNISIKLYHLIFTKESFMSHHVLTHPKKMMWLKGKNWHLLAITRALLFHKHVPKSFWAKALLMATHLNNRNLSRVLGFKSSIEVFSTFHPKYPISKTSTPRTFGCVYFMHVHAPNHSKLDPRALKCIFVRYSSTKKGYKCYHPPTKKICCLYGCNLC